MNAVGRKGRELFALFHPASERGCWHSLSCDAFCAAELLDRCEGIVAVEVDEAPVRFLEHPAIHRHATVHGV